MASILDKIASSSSKLEVLVSSLHNKEVGEEQTSKLISESIEYSLGVEFYSILFDAIYNALWELDDKNRSNILRELAASITSAKKEHSLEDYLNNMDGIEFTPKDATNNKTGGHVISLPEHLYAEVFSDSNWNKLVNLYKNTIMSLGEKSLSSCCESALEKYINFE